MRPPYHVRFCLTGITICLNFAFTAKPVRRRQFCLLKALVTCGSFAFGISDRIFNNNDSSSPVHGSRCSDISDLSLTLMSREYFQTGLLEKIANRRLLEWVAPSYFSRHLHWRRPAHCWKGKVLLEWASGGSSPIIPQRDSLLLYDEEGATCSMGSELKLMWMSTSKSWWWRFGVKHHDFEGRHRVGNDC